MTACLKCSLNVMADFSSSLVATVFVCLVTSVALLCQLVGVSWCVTGSSVWLVV